MYAAAAAAAAAAARMLTDDKPQNAVLQTLPISSSSKTLATVMCHIYVRTHLKVYLSRVAMVVYSQMLTDAFIK